MNDNGGRRSGYERRQSIQEDFIDHEKRSGKDRRSGPDRRKERYKYMHDAERRISPIKF